MPGDVYKDTLQKKITGSTMGLLRSTTRTLILLIGTICATGHLIKNAEARIKVWVVSESDYVRKLLHMYQ